MNYKKEFENFTKWFFQIRKKIENKEYDIFELKKDIEDFCIFLLKNKILDKIRNAEFPISMHHKTNLVDIGGVLIGGQGGEKNSFNQKRRVVVQSMAISSLNCVDKLFDEFIALAKAGSKIIRIAVTGISDAKNIECLCKKLEATEYSKIPIVMCGQYNVYPIISQTNILDYIAKLRINPGNICLHKKDLDNFASTIKYLVDFNKNIEKTHPGKKKIAIRIGVNWGSLDEKLKSLVIEANAGLPEKSEASDLEIIALVLSVIFSGLHAEFLGFEKDLIVASCKTSEAESAYLCSKLLSLLCDYPIHLGITEAGSGEEGVILSAMGLGRILSEKIGDTLRVSITPKIGESRTREVIVAKQILSSASLLSFKPKITSCPGCGRTDSQYFRVLAEEVGKYVDQNLESWCSKYENEKIKDIKIAVMGCLVNGPGEMGHAHIGISLPGFRENNACLVYLDGEKHCVLKGDDESVKEQFFEIIEFYIKKNFSN